MVVKRGSNLKPNLSFPIGSFRFLSMTPSFNFALLRLKRGQIQNLWIQKNKADGNFLQQFFRPSLILNAITFRQVEVRSLFLGKCFYINTNLFATLLIKWASMPLRQILRPEECQKLNFEN